jgi:putative Holliday junction resolvase
MQERILAIDFGLRRVGVAVSDSLGLLAHGREPLRYKTETELLRRLCELARAEEVATIVIGLPLHMDGHEGEMAARVRRLQDLLAAKLSMPVALWDERFTSVQAERLLNERGIRYSRKKEEVDKLAAVFILQSYLDRQRVQKNLAQPPKIARL